MSFYIYTHETIAHQDNEHVYHSPMLPHILSLPLPVPKQPLTSFLSPHISLHFL
jgi:hypothetical protein